MRSQPQFSSGAGEEEIIEFLETGQFLAGRQL
jgi:hypothetical protein